MNRRERLEDEDNADRWMISYADFITLLFAFFVVMYAISSVNNEKYKVLSETLQRAFEVEVSSLQPIQIGDPTSAPSPHFVDVPDARSLVDPQVGNTEIVDPVEQAESMLGGFAQQKGVSVRSDEDWLELEVNADVLFAPNQARLSGEAQRLLRPALALLLETQQPITIEGYSDNVPSETVQYPSNWELSSARASAVARWFEQGGVRQRRLTAIGYGENHPVQTNATPTGRAANRRVVIVVARRTDVARNLNTRAASTLKATVRTATPSAPITGQRTREGGLIFNNTTLTPPAEAGEAISDEIEEN